MISSLASLLLLSAISLKAADAKLHHGMFNWNQLHWSCIDESAAEMSVKSSNNIHCMSLCSRIPGDVVAQWNSATRVCSAFHFQRVCRLASAQTPGSSSNCTIFANAEFESLRQSQSNKLIAVWHIAGQAEFPNLLCTASDPKSNKFFPKNVTFSEEGVVLNGANSVMSMNKSEYMDFGNGLTWLLRIKRVPIADRSFIESMECSEHSKRGRALVEHPEANQLHYVSDYARIHHGNFETEVGTLPNDPNAWMSIALVANDTMRRLFINGSFLASDKFVSNAAGIGEEADTAICLTLGGNLQESDLGLSGTVRAVGVANRTMTEAEIREFFADLP